jgi:hypothetical protein
VFWKIALFGAAAAAALATAVTSVGAGAACAPAGAHRLASSASAEVYSLHRAVYGCSQATGRRTKLGQTTSCIMAGLIAPVRVSGGLTAYGVERCGVDTGSASVVVLRLADGERLKADAAITGPVGPESHQSVDSLVLRRDGSIAWIAQSTSIMRQGQQQIEVHRDDRSERRVLDRGARIDPESLGLHGSRLTWKHGGATRSAQLR